VALSDREIDAFYEWLKKGLDAGWVEEACATHDGVPSTDAEDAAWEAGSDPCQFVLRLWGPEKRTGQPDDLDWR
jgi:hypothetical protein